MKPGQNCIDYAALWKRAAKKYRAELEQKRERKRAALDLTKWQRVYLAKYIVQSEIDDQETWLEYEESEVMKDAIKPRLDALRKLKALLEEGGKQ